MKSNTIDRYEGAEAMGYTRPEPSLCDTCDHSGFTRNGSVTVGDKCYPQRYCSKLNIGLHTSGKQECSSYQNT